MGTTFTFYLPAVEARPVGDVKAESTAVRGGVGTLLFMDDDATVLRVGKQMLERLGYDVVAVADGAAAVREYRKRQAAGQSFAAVILDLTVAGGMGGLEAVKALRALDPQVCAIVSSGYSTAPIMAQATTHGFRGVLAKPFTIEDLGRELKAAGVRLAAD